MQHSASLTHLVLVAGHAIYKSIDFSHPTAETNWFLQPFQKDEPAFYLEHIRAGIELVASDPKALLVFSGGQTRKEAGPRSEAQSYWMLAQHFGWWSWPHVETRATTEEFARDSFENLLFGICRFYEWTQAFPESITCVSWSFKEERFQLHRETLQIPKERFHFLGVNQPIDLSAALQGEMQTLEAFRLDPQGEKDPLAHKRKQRNPFHRIPPYRLSCPPMRRFLKEDE